MVQSSTAVVLRKTIFITLPDNWIWGREGELSLFSPNFKQKKSGPLSFTRSPQPLQLSSVGPKFERPLSPVKAILSGPTPLHHDPSRVHFRPHLRAVQCAKPAAPVHQGPKIFASSVKIGRHDTAIFARGRGRVGREGTTGRGR